jgi:integrase
MRGSITKRAGKNGVSYYPRITIQDPVTGASTRKRLPTQRTRKAAEEAIRKALHELRVGVYVDASVEPLGTFLTRWLDAVESSLGESTVYSYRAIIRNRIVPKLGEIPHNVAVDVRPPTLDKREPATWTVDHIRAFLAATADDPRWPLWRLALDTGMRLGELLALSWADVAVEDATLIVRRTVTRSRTGGWKIGDAPKTNRGRRFLALAPSTVAALRCHRAAQDERRRALGPGWQDLDLVFDRGDGGLASEYTMQKAFAKAIEKAGVPGSRSTNFGTRTRHCSAKPCHPDCSRTDSATGRWR